MFWAVAGCCVASAVMLMWSLRNEPNEQETAASPHSKT
jgi:hypothetical protein